MTGETNMEALVTAAALWEEVVSERANEPYQRVLENIGTVALRYEIAALVGPCMAEWNALSGDDQEARSPYDWEFCPWFLNERCIWTPTGPIYKGQN